MPVIRAMACVWALGLVSSIGCDAPAAAQDAATVDARLDTLFGEHQPYRAFLARLQRAVAADARREVAELVSYPLAARLGGHQHIIRTPRQFVAEYSELLPPQTLTAIRTQAYDSLFANDRGVMIGAGEVWFSAVCSDKACAARAVRIIAVNPPVAGEPP
jgi:hypothetical protein